MGYIVGNVLDPTFGNGTFWGLYQPPGLTACDLNINKSPLGKSIDFTNLPWGDQEFDTVVLDAPYKLNGRPDPVIDEPYGVHVYTRWQDRMKLLLDGTRECARVCSKYLLVKCQNQVVSGHVVWQTDGVRDVAIECGFKKVDQFEFLSYRPQPEGRTQQHARRNSSTLLVFERANTRKR